MKYEEFVANTNNLIMAGDLINSLQRGEVDRNWLLHSLLYKQYTLSSGKIGDILCLAIELQKYIAALQILEYNVLVSDEDIVRSLKKSIEHFNGEEDLAKFKEGASNDVTYQKIIAEKEANIRALDVLKERYLGKAITR